MGQHNNGRKLRYEAQFPGTISNPHQTLVDKMALEGAVLSDITPLPQA
jgi:hypothetical protein